VDVKRKETPTASTSRVLPNWVGARGTSPSAPPNFFFPSLDEIWRDPLIEIPVSQSKAAIEPEYELPDLPMVNLRSGNWDLGKNLLPLFIFVFVFVFVFVFATIYLFLGSSTS
jgi:hypothetical protein